MTVAHPSLQQMRGELHVGEEFLAKYNRPGPRYTSYPTAPVWNEGFGPADLERVHDEAERASTPVSMPDVFVPACLTPGTTGLMVVHNHPSGDPTPSPDDHAIVARLRDVGVLLGIDLLDALIVTDPVDGIRSYSFREAGVLR